MAAPNNNNIMRPDDILDFSPYNNISHFQGRKEKYQFYFLILVGMATFCIFCMLGVILKVPPREIELSYFWDLVFFAGFFGGTFMLCAPFYKFLATHHERNIAAYQKTTYPFANDIFISRVCFFLSTLIFAIVSSFTYENSEKNTSIPIIVFFYIVGLKGGYQWALYLDHKIRTATNYDARINIILPRFLIFLGLGLLIIFDVFLNNFYITNSLQAFAREFGHDSDKDWRMLIGFFTDSLFFNYLVFGAFSLFLWIHTILSFKNQDAENA
jgi:hypothetical protein